MRWRDSSSVTVCRANNLVHQLTNYANVHKFRQKRSNPLCTPLTLRNQNKWHSKQHKEEEERVRVEFQYLKTHFKSANTAGCWLSDRQIFHKHSSLGCFINKHDQWMRRKKQNKTPDLSLHGSLHPALLFSHKPNSSHSARTRYLLDRCRSTTVACYCDCDYFNV